MKKIILSIVVTLSAIGISAQTINVHFKNGQTIQFSSNNVEYVDFSLKTPDPTLTPGRVVDLGLSVYWASCNLGAESPEEYGDYFAWGETSPKNSYTQNNYAYYNTSTTQYTDIGTNIACTDFDAATVNLGNDWNMPTAEQMKELLDKCTWEWTQLKGVNGYNVTGPNGHSIFMPAAGDRVGSNTNYPNEWLYYLTSSVVGTDKCSSLTKSYSNEIILSTAYRYIGCTIRPVTNNINAGGTSIDHSNDYLVTDKISASFAGGAYSSFNDLINAGSQLMWRFANGSSESVTLTGIQLINGVTNVVGNNMLSENVEVAAGETKVYTVTVGAGGIQKPKIRFTYRYNQMSYYVEASMPSM